MIEEDLFHAAVTRTDPADRAAFLNDACAGDDELRRRIEELIQAHERAGDFLASVSGETRERASASAPTFPDTGVLISPNDVATVAIPSVELNPFAPRPSSEQPGNHIGPYRLIEILGEGGMGTVFLAEQRHPVRRQVALKVIKAGMDTVQIVARFEAERQALALMDHPNIARVLDVGSTPEGRPYFVMELVQGVPITRYCDNAHLTPRQRLDLFLPVCQAIQHAHQKGVVHRDIKPSNVLITEVDGKPVPKVIDFGIAKAIDQRLTERTIFTRIGTLVGTPEYMSPEQAGASPDVDTRTDVYSLGVLLYELLTGTTPLDRETLRRAAFDEVLKRVREEEPPKPSTRLSVTNDRLPSVAAVRATEPSRLAKLVRGELDWVVMKALEKDRARRYETANGLARDIQRYLDGDPVEAGPPSRTYRLRKFAGKHRASLVTAAAFALVLIAATAFSAWEAVRATRSEHAALQAEASIRRERDRALKAEKQAAEAAREARNQASIAQAIVDFLQNDLLAQAMPENNPRNQRVTVEDVLHRAAARIAGKFDRQPEVEAAIRLAIGTTYESLGLHRESQPHLERALEIRRRVLGPEHPETLIAMNRVASQYGKQAGPMLKKAESMYAQALDVSRRVNGPEHSFTTAMMNNLALAYSTSGRDKEAAALYASALEIKRRVPGPADGETLVTMSNLADTYRRLGQYEKAEAMSKMVLETQRRTLGPEHPLTLGTMLGLAFAYEYRGLFEEAEAMCEQMLEARRRVSGPEHPETLVAMWNLARMYHDHGKLANAEPLLAHLARVVPGRKADLPDWVLPSTLVHQAKNFLQQGRYAEAEAAAREAVRSCEGFGPDGPHAYEAISVLGAIRIVQKRYAEAEPLILSSYEGMKAREAKIPAIKRFRLRQVAKRVVALYEAWGKPEKANEWRIKLGLAELPEDVFAPP